MAIPAIGNGRPKLVSSAHELKGAMSHVVEVEWAKFSHFFFFLQIGPLKKKKVPHLTDLNCRLGYVDARFKHENAVIFEIRC